MKSLCFLVAIVLCAELLPHSVRCQDAKTDTTFLTNAITHTKAIYRDETAGEGPLFNGVQYKELALHNNDEGHPYFESDDWIEGSVNYDGGQYDNVLIQYDLITDKVVIDHPLSHFKMELIGEKVNAFILNSHKMIRLTPDSTNTTIKPGFYELLYDGKLKVYAKHRKIKQEQYDSDQIKFLFDQKTQYYILKDNIYYPVKSKSSVLKVFRNKKVMLRKYLSKNKINFRKNTGLAIAKSAEFYEESEKQP
jgi:hypothetical protein